MEPSDFTEHVEDNASRIRALRLSLGLTGREVAEAMGWHQASRLFNYEQRHLPFSEEMERRITAAMQVAYAAKAGR